MKLTDEELVKNINKQLSITHWDKLIDIHKSKNLLVLDESIELIEAAIAVITDHDFKIRKFLEDGSLYRLTSKEVEKLSKINPAFLSIKIDPYTIIQKK